jgi:hypothetical protein
MIHHAQNIADSAKRLKEGLQLLKVSRPHSRLVQDAVHAEQLLHDDLLVAAPAVQELEKKLLKQQVHASITLAKVIKGSAQVLLQMDIAQQTSLLDYALGLQEQRLQLLNELPQLLHYGFNELFQQLHQQLLSADLGALHSELQHVRRMLTSVLQYCNPPAPAAAQEAAAAEPFPAKQSDAAAATDAAASSAAELGLLQFSAEVDAGLKCAYPAAAPCSSNAQASSCSTFDPSCPAFFSSTSSMAADLSGTAAAAAADGMASSTYYAAPSWSCERRFGSASSMPAECCSTAAAAAAAADSTAASSSTGCMPCNTAGSAVADELPQVHSAGGCIQAEVPAGCGCAAEPAAAAAPNSAAAGCKGNKAAAAGLLIGATSSSSLLSSPGDGAQHFCSDLDGCFVEVIALKANCSSSSSISSKSSLLAADDGPATPAVVSLAASCAASARTSCAECSDGGSSRSSDNDATLSSNSSKQQQRGAGKGGFISSVVGCVVGPLKELLLHATA